MPRATEIQFGTRNVVMTPHPIEPTWIREGSPVARRCLLSKSEDGAADMVFWDCTAGRFDWHYTVDESIYFIEGSVVVTDAAGVVHRLGAGDTAFFPAGSSAEWHVERYVRKVAFSRIPLSARILRAKRIVRGLRRLVGKSSAPETTQMA